MEQLWSMSTSIREAERIVDFAKTAYQINGELWTKDTQIKFQILLIQNRFYLSPENTQSLQGLSREQISILENVNYEMSFEEAKEIFEAKQYEDPPMRGRQSMNPLKKLGLMYLDSNNCIVCTDVCLKLIHSKITIEEFMFDSLLKYQYPNPLDDSRLSWNTKPFINTLRLIKRVNEKVPDYGMAPRGLSNIEFGIFVLSLKNYRDIDRVADLIIDFRSHYQSLNSNEEKQSFVDSYIEEYLSDFNNPTVNVKEYTDNIIRYLRLTKYIYIRGKYSNTYIDLEPRRQTEIEAILSKDNGSAKAFSKDEWVNYIGTYSSYELPFETIPVLTTIANQVLLENDALRMKMSIPHEKVILETDKDSLKMQIEKLRNDRTLLQNLEIKFDYLNDISKIDDAINALKDLVARRNKGKKFSIELEKWINVALNIINDSQLIKPNSKVGDDNEPIFTAPAGVPDIECFYKNFNSICEVTMLVGRDQWFNEGQPVQRHLKRFSDMHSDKNNYCLFVAPSLHVDTLSTFLTANKYGYEGEKLKIVPITIGQMVLVLSQIKDCVISNQKYTHDRLLNLFNRCADVTNINCSSDWLNQISNSINSI